MRASQFDSLGAIFRKPTVRDLALLGPVGVTVAGIVLEETLFLSQRWKRPGRMFTVDGRQVHVLGQVGASPTVVLESGAGQPLSAWRWIFNALRENGATSVVSYERPGIGFSVPAAELEPERYPQHLMRTLETIGAPPPYILVGHSIGSLLMQMFAASYADLVVGMVLVDPVHPDQYERSDVQRRERGVLEQRSRSSLGRFRLDRARSATWLESYRGLPVETARATAAVAARTSTLRAARREVGLGRTLWAAGARRLSEVQCPVVVLSAGSTVSRDPVVADLQRELAELSATNRHEVVAEADGMTILTDQRHAAHVVRAVDWIRSSPPSDVPSRRN